jgi:hypothetical protein
VESGATVSIRIGSLERIISIGHLQVLLEVLDYLEDYSSVTLRERLQRSTVLYVLLIKRHGEFSERMDSGYMTPEYWPTTRGPAKMHACRERTVLILHASLDVFNRLLQNY